MWLEPVGIGIIPNLIVFVGAITIPGYLWTLAFYPEKNGLGRLERFAFSLLFSITFLPMAVLLENVLLGVPVKFLTVFSNTVVLGIISVLIYSIRVQKIKAPEFVYSFLPKVKKEESVGFLPKLLK